MSQKKIVIIGAGCAGLSAAYTFKKKEVDCVVLESSGVAGGRCRNEIRDDGYNLSLGAGMTEPQWSTTFNYLSELGMLDDVREVKEQKFGLWRKERLNYIHSGSFKETVKFLPQLLKFRGLPPRAYPELVKFGLALSKHQKKVDTKNHNFDGLLELGDVSAAEFCLKHGAPEVLDRIINPFLNVMVLGRAREVTIAHIIALTSLMKGMCTMKDGMGSITAALYEQVKDNVKLNTPVKKVIIENKEVRGVETAEGFIEADQVICGTDAFIARQIIPDLPDTMRKPLETCKYSSTYGYIFGLEKKVTPDYFIAAMLPASENSLLSTIYDLAGGYQDNTPPGQGHMNIFTAGWHDKEMQALSDEERRRTVIKETQKYIKGFPSEPLFTRVIRYDRAINLESPGQFPAIDRLLKNNMKDVKGLYLAGEYLFLIACTEGAMATGEKAALSAIDDM